MKKFLPLLLSIVLINSTNAQLDTAYTKFKVVESEAVGMHPVWGKTDSILYVNVKGWRKYNLNNCSFTKGLFYEYPIAVNTSTDFTPVSDLTLISVLETNKDWMPGEIKTSAGNKISTETEDYRTAIRIDGEKIVDGGLEVKALALSPSGKFLACIFDHYALFVFDLKNEFTVIKKIALMTPLEKAGYYWEKRDMYAFEKTVSELSKKDKKTLEYGYYYGLILYQKSFMDSTYREITIKHLLKVCNENRFYDSNVILAHLYQLKDDWKKSLYYAERSIELLPDNPKGYSYKAAYFWQLKDTEKVCEYYQKAFERGDKSIQYLLKDCK